MNCVISSKGLKSGFKQRNLKIIGESRDKLCWRVIPDGCKTVHTYHKSFIAIIIGTTE